ncbi:restriction endonuclease subunit S [Nocardioides exalbidus]|uniref:restriction endonuclease subunit S n=1 Tax=Nocardioides exalbidus TaxID=402596 RepID=UPI000B849386
MTKLRDVVAVRGGGTPRRSTAEFYGGSIPWVTPKDMKRAIVSDSSVRLTQAGVDNSPAKLIASGSVLVVVRSGVLKHTLPVALTTAPVTVNQDMKALTPSAEVHPAFLARLVKSLQPRVLTWVRATTADNFPIESLLELDVEIPPSTSSAVSPRSWTGPMPSAQSVAKPSPTSTVSPSRSFTKCSASPTLSGRRSP